MKKFLILLAALAMCVPSQAVLQEKNLQQSLSVLRVELQQAYLKQKQMMSMMEQSNKAQHEQMLSYMKKSNQIGLMLYSQQSDYVFDLTYACNEATSLYKEFNTKRRPYYKININIDGEIARYNGLLYSLEILPPPLIEPMDGGGKRPHGGPGHGGPKPGGKPPFELDSASRADRAMCITYATALRNNLLKIRQNIRQDSTSYVRMSYNLSMLDKYAKKRYGDIQQQIFQDAGQNYFKILGHFGRSWMQAKQAIDNKYSDGAGYRRVHSQWRGPVVLGYVVFVIFYLLVAIGLSQLVINIAYRRLRRLKWLKNAPTEAEREIRWKKLRMLKPFVGISMGALFFAVSIQIVKTFLYNSFFIMASGLLVEYAWLLTAITLSLLVRLRYNQMRHGYSVYMPMVLLGLVIIIFRIIFIPNNVVNLIFPPIALLFVIWQIRAIKKNMGKLPLSDVLDEAKPEDVEVDEEDDAEERAIDDQLNDMEREQEKAARRTASKAPKDVVSTNINDDTVVAGGIAAIFRRLKRPAVHHDEQLSDVDKIPQYDRLYAWASLAVMVVATVLTWFGRTLMSVEIVIWWLFQLTAIQTLTLAFRLLDIYEKARLYDRLRASGITDAQIAKGVRKGDYITKTWFFDLVHMGLVPIAGAYSLLLSITMAADVFNLGDTCVQIFMYPFLNIEGVVRLSIFSIVVVAATWFLFRYLNYAIKAFYRYFRLRYQKRKTGKQMVRDNEVNLTLGYNVIAILVWGTYVIFALILLRIPKSGISIVTAGLATGIGFAMKDLLNNFFYGISLMTGRLRVGDWIECDGVQGRVDSISYQSVQVITTDDTMMSFLNSTLFAKNFRNLTRNNSYELVKIPVGVAYGVNVDHVRSLLQTNIEKLQHNDKYGRPVMDLKNHKVLVLFDSFGDNSVNLTVAAWVLVIEKIVFMGQMKEAIYNTLNDNHIEIPFPQRDLYIKTLPDLSSATGEAAAKK